jgi:hypothetical protein
VLICAIIADALTGVDGLAWGNDVISNLSGICGGMAKCFPEGNTKIATQFFAFAFSMAGMYLGG